MAMQKGGEGCIIRIG